MIHVEIQEYPDKKTRDEWNDFLLNHPNGSVFQSPEYFDLYTTSSRYQPILFLARKPSGTLTALIFALEIKEKKWLPSYLISRIVVVGGPLIEVDTPDKNTIAEEILKALVSYAKNRSLFIEFRNLFDLTTCNQAFQNTGFTFEPWSNLLNDTTDQTLLWERLSRHKQKQILRSLKAGAVVRPAENIEEVESFYHILSDLYRSKIKKPLPPIEIFKKFFQLSVEGNPGCILIVIYNGEIIGGMACPISESKVMYEWYVCGLDTKFHHIHPSTLVTFQALQYASLHTIPTFDFMGLGHPEKPYGVRDFKLQFGGEVVNYGRYFRVNNQFLYSIANLGFKFLAFLKWV